MSISLLLGLLNFSRLINHGLRPVLESVVLGHGR